MPARLFCKTGELAGSSFAIGDEAIIGRQSRNEITLHPSFVSGRHARIYYDDTEACYLLEDLDSSNGTAVDGIPVTEPVRLGPLHVITLAEQLDFIFQVLDDVSAMRPRAAPPPAAAAPTVAATPTPQEPPQETVLADPLSAPQPSPAELEKTRLGDPFAPLPTLQAAEEADTVPPVEEGAKTRLGDPFAPAASPETPAALPATPEKTRLGDPFAPLPTLSKEETDEEAPPPPKPPKPKHFALAITLPDETAYSVPLHEGENIVGRETGCDVLIRDPAVSRRHACLTLRDGVLHLRDLGSKNATFVEGKRLEREIEVDPGSLLRFGLQVEAVVMVQQ